MSSDKMNADDLDPIRRSSNDNVVLELLSEHYGGLVNPDEIPSWATDPTCTPILKRCPTARCRQCKSCIKICFNVALRGKPVRSLRWFLDDSKDAAVKFKDDRYYKIKQEICFPLRHCEIKLRHISRLMVVQDLVLRFRGLKEEDDIIDTLFNEFHFRSLDAWCNWKDGFDRLVYEKYVDSRSTVHFCTGCGERATRFTSRRGEEYEKCSNNSCDYFHKVGSNYATVKKN